jgi:hypothetical protein
MCSAWRMRASAMECIQDRKKLVMRFVILGFLVRISDALWAGVFSASQQYSNGFY